MKRKRILLILLVFLLSALACGTGGPVTRRNNEVRRAALAYELAARGPVDEVLVAFGLTEVRANLGFEQGNTVWLNPLAEAEYLRRRDTSRTYLFLHDLNYGDGTASIVVDRNDAAGLQSHTLTLERESNAWRVVSDAASE
jgi:hypothetical protein